MSEITTDETPVVRMVNITKHFPGVLANDQVDLTLHRGEVLALLGENGAGKSTLMNMLVGLYQADSGEIYVKGELADINSPQDSMALGIGMIHQEFMLVGNMSVAENIVLGMKDLPFVPPMAEIHEKITELSKRYGLQVYPDKIIQDLSVGEQQRVEILKLLYRGADILILDEPTAVLTPGEARDLNEILKKMLAEGKSAIFITHKMDEVMEFSHTVQVLRRGKSVSVCPTKSIKRVQDLANMMVGRDVLFSLERGPYNPGEIKVEVKDLLVLPVGGGKPVLDNVSFSIRGGEIFGIAGVAGNGQQQLTEAITGLLKVNSGTIYLNGKDMTNKTPLQIIKTGVSHIPADRGRMGVVGDMSVGDNLSMKKYRTTELSQHNIIKRGLVRKFADRLIDLFAIKTPNQDTSVKFLSGGNIQKTILAREIDSCGGILVAVYPSRGLDVGATEAVRQNLIKQRDKGSAVLLVSEELEELLMVADKIAVMFEGRIMDIVDAKDAKTEELGMLMAGVERRDI
ncbi:MAG: Monosaccharide-transporting ATPase [Spirochaeta sp.]|jgi:simple sugar transport system ATP-binding protein|uniref:ABC transporter ATP-binding protein n=1 Tax=Sphaerochaeta sp. TaxID=1972642 RepID=UPI003D120692|nr:Monosaccharide-transporting ATPase [Spirochaeta sp.]